VLARTGDAVSGAWGTEIVKGMVKGSTVSLALTDTAGRDAGTIHIASTGACGKQLLEIALEVSVVLFHLEAIHRCAEAC
jgi:hypothetical protein